MYRFSKKNVFSIDMHIEILTAKIFIDQILFVIPSDETASIWHVPKQDDSQCFYFFGHSSILWTERNTAIAIRPKNNSNPNRMQQTIRENLFVHRNRWHLQVDDSNLNIIESCSAAKYSRIQIRFSTVEICGPCYKTEQILKLILGWVVALDG